jgi:hypothetical protein
VRGFQYLIKPFSENAEQQATVNYLKSLYPEILFTTGLLGVRLPAWAAWLLKALGYRNGTPDIHIYAARHGYHALFLEMKCKRLEYIENGKKEVRYPGTVTDEQKEFHKKLTEEGYFVEVAYGSQQATGIIDRYLDAKTEFVKLGGTD